PDRVRPRSGRRGAVHRVHGRGWRDALVDGAGRVAAGDARGAGPALRCDRADCGRRPRSGRAIPARRRDELRHHRVDHRAILPRLPPLPADGGRPPLVTSRPMFDKTTVVAAGNVGATAAQRLAEQELARRVVLVDVIEGVPQGKALDQWESAPIEGFDTRVIGANDYAPAAGSELVVVTAGIARKPGMSRDDLVRTNADIGEEVYQQSKQHCPQAIVA